MISFAVLEHLKFVVYVTAFIGSGFAFARAWFSKEIAVGKAVLKQYEDEFSAAVKKLEAAAVTEVKKIESKL